ncbi:MAG: protein-export chaperone SecB [Gammaproteobacteria bacterium]|nr:protein-export chaperone SecB [Gammaproteobacteria bacterium]
MTNPKPSNGGDDAAPQPRFGIMKIYVKDLSFEAPNTPGSFQPNWQPQHQLDLNTRARNLGEDQFEVVLAITVEVKNNNETAFLIEVQQAGIFQLNDFPEADMGNMLGSFCPNILFPYAREAISDIVTRGGFPQLLLAPVNFDALYAHHLQQQAAKPAPVH